MANLGSLVVSLEANMAKFTSDMGKASQLAEQSMERINKAAEMAKGALEAVGIAVGAHELWEKFNGAVEAADQLQKLSEKTGMTVENLSGLQYAAKLSGVDVDGLAIGLKKLSVSMFDAASGGAQQQAIFKSLGVAYKDSNGGLRDTNAVLLDVADRFSKMSDGAQKSALAVKLFGKAGTDLIPLLKDGSAGIEELTAEAERMGIVISSDMAKKAEEFNDNMLRLKMGMQSVTVSAMESLVPALDDIVKAFLDLNKQKSDTSGFFEAVGTFARWTATAVGSAWLALKDMGDGLGALAAQGAALLHGDIAGAERIGQMRDEQARKNEEQFKRFQAMTLTPSTSAGGESAKDGRTGSGNPSIIDKTAADKIKKFIESIKEQTERVGKGEYAMLRMKAATLGAAAAAEPYIVKLQQAKEAQADLVARQEAQINATDNLIALMDKHDFEDPGVVYDFVKAQQEANDTYNFQTTLLGKTTAEQERLTYARQTDLAVIQASKTLGTDATADLVAQMEKEKAAHQASIDARLAAERSWQTGAKNAINDYVDNITDAAASTKKLLSDAFKGMEDALVSFVKTGKLDFRSLADSIITDLIRIEIQQNVMKPMMDSMSGSGETGIMSIIGSLFGGGRASGGPVSGGTTYLVGENGPELFTAGSSGTITPNHALGGGGVVINVVESPGNGGKTQQRSEGNTRIIDVMVEQVKAAISGDIMRGGGSVSGSLERTYGLNRTAGAF